MPTLALAQKVPVPAPVPDPAQDQGEGDQTDIVVTGQRQQGAVIGDIPPEQQLSQADIRSYGVGSVAELLTELAPQTTSGRGGQPVVLLNGRRISSFAEIRDLPTEAIQRVDILPEEVALKYGYRADQKVVNFVLRRRFRAATVELSDRQATEGGRNTPNAELDLLKIAQD
ncbi:MAG: TonB-dependent receptor, partial [Pseudomonadota bacterium]|nr:TonB-dependent receptor [Pseudomonadota bacterium]